MTDPLSPALADLTDDELREQAAVHVGLRDHYVAEQRPHLAAWHAALTARCVRERNRRRAEARQLERDFSDGAASAWWGPPDVA